jgi:mannuronan 5-epimerase
VAPLRCTFFGLLLCALGASHATAEAWDSHAQQTEIGAVLAKRDFILENLGREVPARVPMVEAADFDTLAEPAALEIVGSDVRLALTQLALSAGSEGQNTVLAAQPGFGAPGIYIRAGTATLADLHDRIAGSRLEPVLRRNGDSYVLRRPIIVLKDAALHIRPDETLTLDGDGGAFLLAFGHLAVEAATIDATAAIAPSSPDEFRPFVASVGSGSLHIIGSRISGLGFLGSDAMSGVAVLTGGLFRSEIPSLLVANHFEDIGGITVNGGIRMQIAGNLIEATRGIGLYVRNSDGVQVQRNIVRDALGDDAMRFSGMAKRAEISDNAFLGGRHAGLRIEDAAQNVVIRGNQFSGYRSHGIIIQDASACVLIASNVITDNRGGAVEIIRSGPIRVADNAVVDNRGPGLSVNGAAEAGQVTVQRNVFTNNRSGIRSASAQLFLSGNEMQGQLPRLYSGDLAQFTGTLLRASTGLVAGDVTIDRAEMIAGGTADDNCSNAGRG